jgi:hypothetical protein
MKKSAMYPTHQHADSARVIAAFFAQRAEPEAVLLTCSCARGKAAPDSCLDIAILISPDLDPAGRAALEAAWLDFAAGSPEIQAQAALAPFSHVDLDFITGVFEQPYHGWTSGPDAFELEIGNFLSYSVPLWTRGERFAQLRAAWLPYYDETLRRERLAMVRRYCANNLEHIPPFIRRGLYFQAFDRLYNAYREFLQALFISRRTYPIAYDKWIREQIVDILKLPELYPQLTGLFEIGRFESDEIARKGETLTALLEEYL